MPKTIDNLINAGKKVLAGIWLMGMTDLACIQTTTYRPEAFEPSTRESRSIRPELPSKLEAIALLRKYLKKGCDDGLEITSDYFTCEWSELPVPGLSRGTKNVLRVDYSKIKEMEVHCLFGTHCNLIFIDHGQGRWSANKILSLGLGKEDYQKIIEAIYSLKK